MGLWRRLSSELITLKPKLSLSQRSVSQITDVFNSENPTPTLDQDTRVLKVGIIGTPNSGKSTLINSLVDRKVCPASSKVHTTRNKCQAIFNKDDAQIIFLDTPGLVSMAERKRFNLDSAFVRDSKRALYEADLIGVIHDASNVYTRELLDIKIIKLLEYYETKPSFLVLNKVDILKSKRKLLDIARLLSDNCIGGKPIVNSVSKHSKLDKDAKTWPNFSEIFMVSALTGDGVEDIKNYLIKEAKPGKWLFSNEIWTDQSAEEIIQKSVRAKLLDFLPQEIPYTLTSQLEYFSINEKEEISAAVTVKTPSSRISNLIAGGANGKLKQITNSVTDDLQQTFQTFVRLRIVLDPEPTVK